MISDPTISSNSPEHWASYDLPHVIINGNCFWAKTRCDILAVSPAPSPVVGLKSLCCTNLGDIICTITMSSHKKILSPENYKFAVKSKPPTQDDPYKTRNDHRLIWDSERRDSPEIIKEYIESAVKLKIAMLDVEEIWNIHPVDLPCYFPDSGQFWFKTCYDVYPQFFRYPTETQKVINEYERLIKVRPENNRSDPLTLDVNYFQSFYSISSDGKVSTFYDSARNSSQEYRRLKVFAEMSS
ncbi:MAG: hypothetical protein HQK56_17240 [Deltaproteobacteria bacterium]|nr:hypothetical protein [Deltaproteobacteria bacterium]